MKENGPKRAKHKTFNKFPRNCLHFVNIGCQMPTGDGILTRIRLNKFLKRSCGALGIDKNQMVNCLKL